MPIYVQCFLAFIMNIKQVEAISKSIHISLCRLEIDTISFVPDSTELRVTVTIQVIVNSALDCDSIRRLEEQALMWDGHWK